MAATLADINKTLISVDENTQKTSKGINGFLTYLKGRDAKEDRKDLEASREARKVNTKETQQSSSGTSRFSGFKLPSFNLPNAAALAAGALAFTSRLFKRGLVGGLLTTFAEEIADFFLPGQPGEKQLTKDLRKYLVGGLEGFGLGYILFGKKGGILGGILGALTKNKKVDEQLGRLTDNLEKLAKVIFGPDYKGGFAKLANTIAGTAGTGLERLNNLIEGKNFSTENIAELKKDILGAAGVLGVFGFFASSKFRKALLSIRTLKRLPVIAALTAVANALGYTFEDNSVAEEENNIAGGGGGSGPSMFEIGAGAAGATYLTYKGVKALRGDPRKIDLGYDDKVRAANKLSSSTLNRAGLEKKGGGVQQKGGKFASEAQLDKALGGKYPRLFSGSGLLKLAKGVGPLAFLSGIFTSSEALAILNDPNKSEQQKKAEMGELLGREVNATTFALIGGALMGLKFGPFGIAGGAIAGSLLSGLAPNVAGGILADFLMSKGAMSESQKNKILSLNNLRKRANVNTGGYEDISSTMGIVSPLPATSASRLGNNLPGAMTMGGGTPPNPNTLITSQNNYSTQNQSLIVGHPSSRDRDNPLNQRLILQESLSY